MSVWKSILIGLLAQFFQLLLVFTPATKFILRAYCLAGLRRVGKGYVPNSTQFDGPVRLIGTGKLRLGEYCRLGRNLLFETNDDAEIVIGNRVRINDGTVITAHKGIVIGDDAMIGEYVSIRDANHGVGAGVLIRTQAHQSQAIKIGRDVWIGRGCCILKGVEIAEGAVIGANSVVTCNVPANAIFAGVPAKLIRMREWSV